MADTRRYQPKTPPHAPVYMLTRHLPTDAGILRWMPASIGSCQRCGRIVVGPTANLESERDELAQHGVTFDEAVECFFSDFQIRRNKKYRDRHQLLGRALGGRKLKIIFQLKTRNVVRIITGWPL